MSPCGWSYPVRRCTRSCRSCSTGAVARRLRSASCRRPTCPHRHRSRRRTCRHPTCRRTGADDTDRRERRADCSESRESSEHHCERAHRRDTPAAGARTHAALVDSRPRARWWLRRDWRLATPRVEGRCGDFKIELSFFPRVREKPGGRTNRRGEWHAQMACIFKGIACTPAGVGRAAVF